MIACALCAAGIAAAPASATVVQTTEGDLYTGMLEGGVLPAADDSPTGFAFAVSLLEPNASGETLVAGVGCDYSEFTGAVTDAGAQAQSATAEIDDLDWGGSDESAPCFAVMMGPGGPQPTNGGLSPLGLPWNVSLDWVDDNTVGDPNGTAMLSGAGILVTILTPSFELLQCAYGGYHDAVDGQIELDVRNTANGAEYATLTFDEELLRLEPAMSDENCPLLARAAGSYGFGGEVADQNVDLEIRQALTSPPPPLDPQQPDNPQQLGAGGGKKKPKKKCGKKKAKPKKSAAAAKKPKKKCGKKKPRKR